MGGVFKVVHHFLYTEDEPVHIFNPGIKQAPSEVSCLILARLGGREVGHQTLHDRLEIFPGLSSVFFVFVIKDSGCLSFQEVLRHFIHLQPILQNLSLYDLL